MWNGSKNMKIIFFGSDDFAAVSLKRLIDSGQKIVAIVTQPDRPKGRGLKVTASTIKVLAQEQGMDCLQPPDFKEPKWVKQLQSYQADLFIVIAYGQILPGRILGIPRLGAINVHASLLPKYRGAAPINWAILKGEKETGVTVIQMNEQMDAGDIVSQSSIAIQENDNAVTLRAKLAVLGADILLDAVTDFEKRQACGKKQDDRQVSLAPKLTKELGLIDWRLPAAQIHNLVRGLIPWPSAYTYWEGRQLKILETEMSKGSAMNQQPGEIIEVNEGRVVVQAGRDALLIKKVHLESAKPMEVRTFITGHKISVGTVLTNPRG